jgi:negative regulator of flagellin synthesis FlgM
MDFSIKNQPISLENYVSQVGAKHKTEPPDETTQEQQAIKTDTVRISESARQIRDAQMQIKEIPDVREDKVSEIKKMIAEGTYKIEPEKIADKMLSESLINDLLK